MSFFKTYYFRLSKRLVFVSSDESLRSRQRRKRLYTDPVKRAPWLFLIFSLGLIGGVAGESLLLLKRHCTRFEAALRDDFRVLVFLKGDVEGSKLRVLQEKLRALPDVEEARYVSRDAALASLRLEDPDLVESVTWLGENPLPPAYELRLSEGGLQRFPQWLTQAGAVADWAEIRYKPAQIRALLQARFYRHFLSLTLSACVCAAAAAGAAGFWILGARPRPLKGAAGPALTAAAGTLVGIAAVCLLTLPVKGYFPWWSLPPGSAQLLLLAVSGGLGALADAGSGQ